MNTAFDRCQLLILALAGVVPAALFYVAPSGNNTNTGDIAHPWATPGYGSRQARPGDTLIVLSGRYSVSVYDDIMKPRCGASNAWITIQGQAGARPVIAGSNDMLAAVLLEQTNQFLRIENLEFCSDHGAYFRDCIAGVGAPIRHLVLSNLYIHHVDEFGLDLQDVSDALIADCVISYCGYGSIGGPSAAAGGWQSVAVIGCCLSYAGHYYHGGPGPSPYARPDGFGIEASGGPVEIVHTTSEHNRGDGLDSKAHNTHIHHCIVANNSCDGVKIRGTNSTVRDTLIYGMGDGVGGSSPWAGLVVGVEQAHALVTIENVTIHDNPSRQAYMLYVQYDQTTTPLALVIRNCIAANGFGSAYFGPSVTLCAHNNLFFRPGGGNQVEANAGGYTAGEILAGDLGPGNLSTNPVFIAPAWGTTGDYHLAAASPCIDVGTNLPWMADATDLDGHPRSVDGLVDMGCYEFVPEPAFMHHFSLIAIGMAIRLKG